MFSAVSSKIHNLKLPKRQQGFSLGRHIVYPWRKHENNPPTSRLRLQNALWLVHQRHALIVHLNIHGGVSRYLADFQYRVVFRKSNVTEKVRSSVRFGPPSPFLSLLALGVDRWKCPLCRGGELTPANYPDIRVKRTPPLFPLSLPMQPPLPKLRIRKQRWSQSKQERAVHG